MGTLAVMGRDRFVWGLRAAWGLQPIVSGTLFAAAVAELSGAVALTTMLVLWFGWAIAFGALMIPLPLSLTVMRPVVGVAPLAALWAVATLAAPGDHPWAIAAGVGATGLAAALAMSATIGDRFVDGASYGDERRMLLRPSLAVLLGPVEIAGLVAVGGIIAGPLVLATQRWWFGGVSLVIGVPLAVLAFRALFGLVQRWIVFVPAGVVVRDAASLTDPVLFRREQIHYLGPALADSEAVDLRSGASGVALEMALVEPTALPIIDRRAKASSPIGPTEVAGIVFAPSLPGAALEEASRRRIEVR